MIELKNSVASAEETISKLWDMLFESISHSGMQKKKKNWLKKMKKSLQDLWDTVTKTIMGIMGITEEKKKETENLFKTIMAENIPNLGRDMDVHIPEAQGTPNSWIRKRLAETHCNTFLKCQKQKDFESSKRKVIVTPGNPL